MTNLEVYLGAACAILVVLLVVVCFLTRKTLDAYDALINTTIQQWKQDLRNWERESREWEAENRMLVDRLEQCNDEGEEWKKE